MTDVYKTSKYPNSVNDCGCGYANRIIGELENTEEYHLTDAEKINRIEAFLPKDNMGAKPLSDENLQDMVNSGEYPLTVDEELSHIGAFRKSLPKDNGAQPLSDESLQDMIDSGKDLLCDFPELHFGSSNYKSKVVKESYRQSSK